MHSPVTRFRRTAALAAAAPLLLAGCGALGVGDSDGSASGRQVAAAFYPLAYVADRVAGEHAEVENLTQPGNEPHDLELTIKETATIAEADLVIFEREFQPAVDAAVEANAEGEVLDAADVVDLLPFVEHDHSPDEEHADEGHSDEEEGHDHDHGDHDPHFWQDPARMADLGDAVADQLADLDPDHARDYEANAGELRGDLEKLDQEYADGLESCERDTIVVSHDAFGYLAKYGLHLEPIAGLSPGAEPTPADLSHLQDLIKAEGITTVFSETLVSPKLSETLADDLGIDAEVLDPIEGLTDSTKGEDYLSLMRANLAALQKANGC